MFNNQKNKKNILIKYYSQVFLQDKKALLNCFSVSKKKKKKKIKKIKIKRLIPFFYF